VPIDTFDPLRILASLQAHGVRYVLIGGLAAVAHGSPSETDDVDICLAGDEENLKRMGLALADLGADARGGEASGERVTFQTRAGRLDCFELLPGAAGYRDLDQDATMIDIGRGITVRIASIDDLTDLKRAAGDLSRAAHLAALAHAETEADVLVEPEREKVRLRERIRPRQPKPPKPERQDRLVDLSTDPDPEPANWRERVLRKLEHVDAFLTDLNENGLPNRRDKA
jgi:hypothetical protein